ncbi:O-methyltransferase [Salinactinospora qingdaonensis]|uniref:Class I SAM-dependent methyltransferase n=1 Tax=Salinactinospora qingdaonensis TaxID=702744 RepID=A0ABP7FGZ4_9ACTN
MTRTSENLSPELYEYLLAHSEPVDELLRDLVAETEQRFPDRVGLQIGPEQGTFMRMVAQLAGARDAVEIGTFTGYSAICLARGLAPGGTLLSCDLSEEWTSVARSYWQRAGLSDTITLRLGPALQTLRELDREPRFDLAFIDADKEGYIDYWEELVPRMRSGGTILADNTFSHGRVIDPAATSPAVEGIRKFNVHARDDGRAEAVILPIGDGLTLARVR